MTGDEEAFVVWFISAHPAKRHAIMSNANNPLVIFMVFLSLLQFDLYFSPRLLTEN
jgi:hypothetical protein